MWATCQEYATPFMKPIQRCFIDRSLEPYFYMKNNAFYFHLSLSFIPFQFEKECTDHQETQAQLQKREAKINELQAELQAFKSQVKYHRVNLVLNSYRGNKGHLRSSQSQNGCALLFLIVPVLSMCVSRLLFIVYKDTVCHSFPPCVFMNIPAFPN